MEIEKALTCPRPFYVNVYRFGPHLNDRTPGAYLGVAHYQRSSAEIVGRTRSAKIRVLLYRLRVTPTLARGK